MKNHKGRLQKILYIAVTLSFLLPIGYLVVKLASGADSSSAGGYHSKADYALMLFQCCLGLFAINIPTILEKRLRFELPGLLYGMYIIFLYCAIFLGEVTSFYYLVPGWDIITHFFSSIMIGFFGLMVVTILNRDEHVAIRLSPFFVALFAFSFAVMIGALWEAVEYIIDGALGVNMQKFITSDGAVLAGRAALSDTMEDILVDMLGALIASIAGFFAIKRNKRWYIPVLKDSAVPSVAAKSAVPDQERVPESAAR